MKKQDAINLFGKTQVDLAKALNRTKSAISQWPDDLTLEQKRLVVGAAHLAGKKIPMHILKT